MAGMVRTLGVSLLGAFAVPVAGLSGIAAVFALLLFILIASLRTFGLFLFICLAAGLCYLAIQALKHIAARARELVLRINQKESLALDPAFTLGYPSAAFLAFDKAARKLAICNSATGDYRIHDFAYVLQWYYEWGVGTKMDVGITGGPFIPGTTMQQPTVSHREYKRAFTVVVEVADVNNPILKFPVHGEPAAKRECARLNAVLNG